MCGRSTPSGLCGPVPFRFWLDPVHRRDYLLWLGHKLHFRHMEDYYRLTYVVFVAEGMFRNFAQFQRLAFYGPAEFGVSSWARRAV